MVDERTPRGGDADGSAPTVPGTQHTLPMGEALSPTLVPSRGGITRGPVTLPEAGYELGAQIGRGGMGEVVAVRDMRIGREVALKRMVAQSPSAEATTRFLREARIQARLDHPAIVPVHELGVDEEGRLYFTMKRLAGKTLGQRASEGMSLPSALDAFADVCIAVEFAHARGVVHRDLKPSNIMLGDYGEVYVIDWGIARVLGEEADAEAEPPSRISTTDISTLDSGTRTGALLGTPGYMAPEQLRGQAATPAADSYALGAILFELLVGAPLHPRGESGMATTLSEPQVRASERFPDRSLPPELDQLAFEALAEDPPRRPTARQIGDRVKAYLVGDRDLAKRRSLALEHLASARTAVEGKDIPRAVRLAGQAMFLDPENPDAAALMAALVLQPPHELPPACAQELQAYEADLSRDRSRQAVWTYATLFLLLPAVLFIEVKNWTMVIAFYAAVTIAMGTGMMFRRTGRPLPGVVLPMNLVIVVLFSRIGGPFVLTPLFIAGVLVAMVSIPWVNERTWVVVTWACTAVLAPVVVEQLVPSWETTDFHAGAMRIASSIIDSTGTSTAVALIAGSAILTTALALFLLAVTRRRREAQVRLFVQAWHLQQALPGLPPSRASQQVVR